MDTDKLQTLLLLNAFITGMELCGASTIEAEQVDVTRKLIQEVGAARCTDLLNKLRAFAKEKGALEKW